MDKFIVERQIKYYKREIDAFEGMLAFYENNLEQMPNTYPSRIRNVREVIARKQDHLQAWQARLEFATETPETVTHQCKMCRIDISEHHVYCSGCISEME